MQNVNIEQRQIVTIEVPPWKVGQNRLDTKINRYFPANDDIDRVLRSRYFFSGIEHGVRLRLATPEDLGCPNGVYSWNVGDMAKRNGLQKIGYDSVVVRLAMIFEQLKPSLPEKYLSQTWRIHMSPIKCMTGDKFISGVGYPSAKFEIWPNLQREQILSVDWVYQCYNDEQIEKDQPMLFGCMP